MNATLSSQNPSVISRLIRDIPALVAIAYLSVIVLVALCYPIFATTDPYVSNMRLRLRPPNEEFLLGTDTQGRDLMVRMAFGLRTTLLIALVATAFGSALGATIGVLAAFYKKLDNVLMRVVDMLLSFPAILFGLALAAVLGPGLFSLIIALSVAAVPPIARVARGAAMTVMQQEYIESGRAIGLSDRSLISRYLVANCFPTILVYATLQLGQLILLGVGLSFLGLGVQPPMAELGAMASEGRSYFTLAPHVSTLPSVLIFSIALSINLVGDAFRDALDPKMRP